MPSLCNDRKIFLIYSHSRETEPMKLPRLLPFAALLVFLCSPFSSLPAADDVAAKSANKLPRILFVTQSFEFHHSAVQRKGDQLSPAEKVMTDLANSSGVFQIDCTQDAVEERSPRRTCRTTTS